MQHAFEIYSLRVHDAMLEGSLDERYAELDNVRNYSIIELIYEALERYTKEFKSHDDMLQENYPGYKSERPINKMFRLEKIEKTKHQLFGIIRYGEYGSEHDVVSKKTGKKTKGISEEESVINDHFIFMAIKPNEKKGILFLHSIRGKGIKGLFGDIIQPQIRDKTKLHCQIRPLAYGAAVKDWYKNAEVCEVRISRFTRKIPDGDLANYLSDHYVDVVYKPKKRNMRLAKLNKLNASLMDIKSKKSELIKAVVELNGKKRIFRLGVDDAPISTIDFEESDEIKYKGGNPTISSVRAYSGNLVDELWPSVIKGNN